MGVIVSRIRRTIVRVLLCSGSVERSKRASTVPREFICLAADTLVVDIMAYLCRDAFGTVGVGHGTCPLSGNILRRPLK
jgi:hypothetical protein